MSLGLLRPCLTCGEPSPGSRCPEHEALRARGRSRPTYRERGYDAAWDRLSRRVRSRQNFCMRCQATDNLSVDHLPIAWHRWELALPVRLRDVQVVCARCQSELGSSRPGSARYEEWERNRG